MASGFIRKTMVFLGLDDEEMDDYDGAYDPDVAVAPQPPRRYPVEPVEVPPMEQPRGIRPIPRDSQDSSGSVTVRPQPRSVVPVPNPKVHVVAPVRFSDAQEIGDRFKGGQPVIVNLQIGEDPALARRMIDFCSGVTYALSGSMDKVADQVFLLTPTNVEVSAEEKRRLKDQGLYRS
jgi:cell division inhibitor SepF